ncbi:formate dehydrogenase accessory protein FdhE [Methylogaea oryzae]|uniref:Protein FdhE n=1 Tax=Methylogaea oryzae TaxID=1295382 RepID=A0A8D4VQI2_9GAMM|nr:formate dehydrogenase accessory protein FdhE [Methylogaea oryzae]BBL70782.1 protein FdhE [Methylogaea oryzae]
MGDPLSGSQETAREQTNNLIRLPDATTLFHHRAARFRQLACKQQSMAGYLSLLAELAEIQHCLAERFTELPPPAKNTGLPLDIVAANSAPAWREALRHIAMRMEEKPSAVGTALVRIGRANDAEMAGWAEALLLGTFDRIDTALAPFVAAALQAFWTSQAAGLNSTQLTAPQQPNLCPACGSPPVASLLHSGGDLHGLRYLCCSLCATQWNRPRIHCAHCGSNEKMAYYGIEGAADAVKAEACGGCRAYLKIMDREKDTQVDPFADDIATLALDLLMAEESYQRLGVNLLLLPGT